VNQDANRPSSRLGTVVFDLGGVLVDWDPRQLYLRLLPDEATVEAFLAEVGFAEWNAQQDAGRPFADAVEELAGRHPDHGDLIRAYPVRFADSLRGEIPGSVAILRELVDAGVATYALSNWSAETFPHALARFAFLAWFDGIVLSGAEGVSKPDARLFRILVDRYDLRPEATVFIDDSPANVAAAAALGFTSFRFSDAATLRDDLARLGLLARVP
jgi:2-haloacid dehalogenase